MNTFHRRDHLFFVAMSLLFVVLVVSGFFPYFSGVASGTVEQPVLIHVHALISSLWIAVFAVQVGLVSRNRTSWHKRLGVFGGALVLAVVVSGYLAAIHAAKRGYTSTGDDPLVFLSIPLKNLVVFAVFVSVGLASRSNPATHKRSMYLATAAGLMLPPISRLPPPAEVLATLTLVFAGPIYDRLRHGKVHHTYKWGIPLGIGITVIQSAVAPTALWIRFAGWLTQ